MEFETAIDYINWIDKQSGEGWSDDTLQLAEVMEDYANMRVKQELSKLHQPTVIGSVCANCHGQMAWNPLYKQTECQRCGSDLAK
jgi:hypothetical protein